MKKNILLFNPENGELTTKPTDYQHLDLAYASGSYAIGLVYGNDPVVTKLDHLMQVNKQVKVFPKQMLVANIIKIFKHDDSQVLVTYNSYDRDKLIKHIEKTYELKLMKKAEDDFPYFTDGGFKFDAENENFKFKITAIHENII